MKRGPRAANATRLVPGIQSTAEGEGLSGLVRIDQPAGLLSGQ